ncbi:alpha/beta hydrolase-fold protein [Gordonia sp. NPDC003425]
MGDQTQSGVSLISGYVPLVVEVAAVVALVVVVARRSGRWWALWVPLAAAFGTSCVVVTHLYWTSPGVAGDPAPARFWWWVGASGFAIAVAILGVAHTRWWRRTASAAAVVLTSLAAALTLNQWIGYFPTVDEAWDQLSGGSVAHSVDLAALTSARNSYRADGSVVPIDAGSATSGFVHRTEYAYLPPAWFRGRIPPRLPAVMMIGGEFNTPADWIRIGDAVSDADSYAHRHDGMSPILVFPDVSGSFGNDTECVDGPRGRVATHLVDEVRPYVIRHFAADPAGAGWGVVGFSMGGTCAVDLVTEHPELFSTFEDIAGDVAPNAGDRAQTIDALFGGDTDAYDDFNPMTVMGRHGRYTGAGGWFDEAIAARSRSGGADLGHAPELAAARELCAEGRAVDIDCSIHLAHGGHTWQFAERAFHRGFGPLARRLGLPAAERSSTPIPA